MKYEFDEIICRSGMHSAKWDLMKRFDGKDVSVGVFPYSVADMEFRVSPEIRQELEKLNNFGIFGYHSVSPEIITPFVQWLDLIHGWKSSPQWMTLTPGVIPALNTLIRAFTEKGDGVIIQPPVYPPFYSAVKDNGRREEKVPLLRRLTDSGQLRYEINFDALEKAAAKNDVKMLILCSPHNPVSRVWKTEELKLLADICAKHGVFVVSDEIHCDLLFNGHKHMPFGLQGIASDENWAVCMAPSKTFNLAGMSTAVTLIKNEKNRRRFLDQSKLDWGGFYNLFGMKAFSAAYAHGSDWYKAMLSYVEENQKTVLEFFRENFPSIPFAPLEGTYLLWADFSSLGMEWQTLERFLSDKAEFFADEGYIFGPEGQGHERINVACPRSVLLEGLERLKKALETNRQ